MMKTQKLRHLVSAWAAILVFNQSYFGIDHKHRASAAGGSQNELAWFPFVPADEEITAMVPAPATVLAVEQFLSSLHLRRPQDRVTPPATPSSEYIPVNVFNGNEVTRKAIVVWKPEPIYTDQARAHRVVGTVILDAIFVAEGYVANITVTKELKDGLTERAIDVARSIRFLPAEKDGKPVSQRMRLEYNFNLY